MSENIEPHWVCAEVLKNSVLHCGSVVTFLFRSISRSMATRPVRSRILFLRFFFSGGEE